MVKHLKLLALDVDGVVTYGCVGFTSTGQEIKSFDFHDLDAVTQLNRLNIPTVFITGEEGPAVDALAQRFNVAATIQGAKDKLAALKSLAAQYHLTLEEICYVGDSDRDAPAIAAVGLGLAPANATPAARAAAHCVLTNSGGNGAVAEAVRLILMLQQSAGADLVPAFARIVQDSIDAHQRLLDQSLPVLADIASALIMALQSGHKLLLFGNGGSAADAQHVAGEFVGRFSRDRAPLSALALTTDTSIMTSVSNDWSFSDVFARQVRALARPGDVLIGISTSGGSVNVLQGLEAGREVGTVNVGFTGMESDKISDLCDYCFCAPSNETPRVQELHILAWHAICEIIEARLFDEYPDRL